MKSKITFGVLMTSFAFVAITSAEAGRTSTTRCKPDKTAKPVEITTLVAESSRRIHVISEPGIKNGYPVKAQTISVTDEAGVSTYFPGSIGFPNFTDAYVEGLVPGKTYQVKTSNGEVCVPPSVPVTITMPPLEAADAVPPVASGLRSIYAGFVAYSNFIDFIGEDNVGVKGFRAYINGVLIRDTMTEQFRMRGWTNTAGSYTVENGAHLMTIVPDAYRGLNADVTIELVDFSGNMTTLKAKLQF